MSYVLKQQPAAKAAKAAKALTEGRAMEKVHAAFDNKFRNAKIFELRKCILLVSHMPIETPTCTLCSINK